MYIHIFISSLIYAGGSSLRGKQLSVYSISELLDIARFASYFLEEPYSDIFDDSTMEWSHQTDLPLLTVIVDELIAWIMTFIVTSQWKTSLDFSQYARVSKKTKKRKLANNSIDFLSSFQLSKDTHLIRERNEKRKRSIDYRRDTMALCYLTAYLYLSMVPNSNTPQSWLNDDWLSSIWERMMYSVGSSEKHRTL